MLSQLSLAINSYSKAWPIVFRKGFRHYLILPVIINLLLLAAAIWASISWGQLLAGWVYGLLPTWPFPAWVEVTLSWIIRLVLLFIYFSFYKYLVLIVLAPFLAFLSEKVEHEINGCEFPFLWTQLMRDLWRAIIINLRNFILEVLATLALGVLAFVPVVGLLSPLVMLLVQSYFFGFALMDYNAERHRMNRRSTQRWMRAHFWTVVGIGLIFHFAFLIPLAGWILAPIWGTAAGTLSFLNLAKKSKSSDWILDN